MKKLIIIVVLAGLLGGYEVKDYLPDEIAAVLAGNDPAARADAADQVEKMPPEQRKAVLQALARDERAKIRLLAVSLLARHHVRDADVVGDLLAVARDDLDGDVKQAAFVALGKSGDPRALKLATEVLSDMDAALPVKLEAAGMLDRLTGRVTAQDLSAALEQAVDAADDLGMDWDDWLTTHGPRLTWDDEKGRFVEKD